MDDFTDIVGEVPDLPPALVLALHQRTHHLQSRASDILWDAAVLFEGWHNAQ